MIVVIIGNAASVEMFIGRETGAAETAGEGSYTDQRKYWGTKC